MSTPLSRYTTLRLGGPARRLIEADGAEALVTAVRDADSAGERLLLLAGGSNVVISDDGFDGTVVRVLSRGMELDGRTLRVQAGEPWDGVVRLAVEEGLSGIECLSGIPGSAGATPIQNVGAYGQEVASTISAVRVLDRRSDEIVELAPDQCGFGYRTSAFKRENDRWVVLEVIFELSPSGGSEPIRYAELAGKLGVDLGQPAPVEEVREAVLDLRHSKGMVLDPQDPDTASAGSFFTNPIVSADELGAVERAAAQKAPAWPEADGRVKTSAAWLIERAGFQRGQGDVDGIAISSKHVLALTNRGSGTTRQLDALASRIEHEVLQRFGVRLVREPTMIG